MNIPILSALQSPNRDYLTFCWQNGMSRSIDQLGLKMIIEKLVMNLDTPEKCESLAKNARERGREELAMQARERAIQLRAERHGASTDVEREALQAVYAYEEVQSIKTGKRFRANRTWQMIQRRGIIESVEKAVNRPVETQAYTALVNAGLQEYAFENVILRYPESFSEQAIKISMDRLNDWKQD